MKRWHFHSHRPNKKPNISKNKKTGRIKNMQGGTFEQNIVKAFNTYFREHHIRGYAFRLKQARYTEQFIDILVDSPYPEFYQAVECKSMGVKGQKVFSFNRFTKGQIENENQFIQLTGRRGILAVELRHDKLHTDRVGKKGGPKSYREAYLVPWEVIWEKYLAGEKSITFDEIRKYPAIKREKSLYTF